MPGRSIAGRAGALLLAAAALGCGPPRPSVLIVTVDTLRADHLSLYGYARETSPRLDALAARGRHFSGAVSAIPQTGPACASLLTGRWPASLDLHRNARTLPDGPATLAGTLRDAGYDTAAFVSGYPLVRKMSGLQRGFIHYDDLMPDPKGRLEFVQRSAHKTTNAVLAWLDARTSRRPFLLWVHYYDPHGSYEPVPPYGELFQDGRSGPHVPLDRIPDYQALEATTDAADYIRRYDQEVRFTDAELGRLVDGLRERGMDDRLLVLVTADHGESLVEHGYYFDHGNELYAPSLHVPLVVWGPGVPADPEPIRGVVRTPDLFPTVLELVGLEVPEGLAGRSLATALRTGELAPAEALSEARLEGYRKVTADADVGPKLAVRSRRFTAILRLDTGQVEAYDRLADPGEERDLLAEAAAPGAGELREALRLAFLARLELAGRGGGDGGGVLSGEIEAMLDELAPGGGR